MTILKVKRLFLFFTLLSIVLLAVVIYKDKQFKNNPLSDEVKQKIEQKKRYLEAIIYKRYGMVFEIPVIISDKLPNNLFGLAAYTKDKKILVYLNKKRFQESVDYMIDYVLPHEYAHALMFRFGNFSKENGGHTKQWQMVCLTLEGKKCDRYVKHDDILFGKIPF